MQQWLLVFCGSGEDKCFICPAVPDSCLKLKGRNKTAAAFEQNYCSVESWLNIFTQIFYEKRKIQNMAIHIPFEEVWSSKQSSSF